MHLKMHPGSDGELQKQLPYRGKEREKVRVEAASAMNCYPEISILSGPHVIGESSKDGEILGGPCFFSLQPVLCQPGQRLTS